MLGNHGRDMFRLLDTHVPIREIAFMLNKGVRSRSERAGIIMRNTLPDAADTSHDDLRRGSMISQHGRAKQDYEKMMSGPP